MLHRDTIRFGIYAAVGAIILTLTGIFGSFGARDVIAGQLNLGTVLLVLFVGGTGYFTARRVQEQGIVAVMLNGAVGGLIVGAGLVLPALLVANDAALREGSIDVRFVFTNLTEEAAEVLTFGQEFGTGVIILLVFSAVIGGIAGWLTQISSTVRQTVLLAAGLTVFFGLLEAQLNTVISLPDALAVAITFVATHLVIAYVLQGNTARRLALGALIGGVIGVVLLLLVNGGGLDEGGLLRGVGSAPVILNIAVDNAIWFMVIFAVVGLVGGLTTAISRWIHNGMVYLIVSMLVSGVLNWQGDMTLMAAAVIFVLWLAAIELLRRREDGVQQEFEGLTSRERRTSSGVATLAMLGVLLVAPLFLGQYITSVLDLMGLYIIMGIGLNIVVGYAGLLDLGYVAFFAIGAYTVGILTTPSLITCGGVPPTEITPATVSEICTGILNFWQAWPIAIIVSALAGILLGIPVLRLRGDYLAIVTLGFGEIIRLIALSNDFKPLLGAAQGIASIPSPRIGDISFGGATTIYYVILLGILVTAFIAIRLANTRLGRAWRAMRADEDVAQAMGINLVRVKLLAFAIGAAFAGMGGAIFGSWLQGIFPNSFTLLVSINVLAMIIIGGLGSIPGVVVGSLMLIGLPEILRELQDYRLLAFGILLVVTMLIKPEGLVPPPTRRLSELAVSWRTRENYETREELPRKELT